MMKYIYKITNLINGKIYIGQTKDYKRRFQEHKAQSQESHKVLYSAFQKYGIDNFKFEVIEQVENYDEREKYWIHFYGSMIPNGYNMTPGGEEPPVFHGEEHHLAQHTQNQINEIKLLLKNSNMTIKEMSQKFNYNQGSIIRINKGELWFDPLENYPLRYEATKDFEKERANNIINDLLTSKMTQKQIAEKYNVARSMVTAINIGQNYKQEHLTYPLRGEKQNCHSRSIYMLDLNTEQILQEFESIQAAANFLKKPNGRDGIRKCALGKGKTAYGYKWRFVEE